jgi:hypothetical protein
MSFLNDSGLFASIYHQGWHPLRGLMPVVMGWVWRQNGSISLGDVSDSEILSLCGLLRAHVSSVISFALTEQLTSDKRGKNIDQRKHKLVKGVFEIEQIIGKDVPCAPANRESE